jgi:DinB superfamily
MAIVPDAKDWTWVLRRPCPECGLDTRDVAAGAVAAMVRANAAAWPELLTQAADVRQRPSPEKWSPLEYGCHVRDALRLYDERLQLMLTQEGPVYPNWDQDVTAVADRYDKQDPATVAAEIPAAAETLARRFDSLSAEQWQRTGHRSDGAHFTVETFARYFVHDPVHHLFDVTGVRYSGPAGG